MHFRARACALLLKVAPPFCAGVPCLLLPGACSAPQLGAFIYRGEVSLRGSILVTYIMFYLKMSNSNDNTGHFKSKFITYYNCSIYRKEAISKYSSKNISSAINLRPDLFQIKIRYMDIGPWNLVECVSKPI